MADEQKVNPPDNDTAVHVSVTSDVVQPMTADVVDEFALPIDQFAAEQHYLSEDRGIPIRNPVTREYYTLYGPRALDVLRMRKQQGFVVVGVDPLEETVSDDETRTYIGDGDGTGGKPDAPTVAAANPVNAPMARSAQVEDTATDSANLHTPKRPRSVRHET